MFTLKLFIFVYVVKSPLCRICLSTLMRLISSTFKILGGNSWKKWVWVPRMLSVENRTGISTMRNYHLSRKIKRSFFHYNVRSNKKIGSAYQHKRKNKVVIAKWETRANNKIKTPSTFVLVLFQMKDKRCRLLGTSGPYKHL